MTASRRIIILIGLVLSVIVPVIGPTHFLPAVPGVDPLYVREWFWWGLTAVVLLYVLIVERRSFASIGFRKLGWRTFAFGALAFGLIAAGSGAIAYYVFPYFHLHSDQHQMVTFLHTPVWFRILLATRAAVMEETLFRGYGIERLQELTGNRWIAGGATWALFTLAHLNAWGWTQLLIIGWSALVLTVFYLWRRDLVSNMVGHGLTDLVGLLVPHG